MRNKWINIISLILVILYLAGCSSMIKKPVQGKIVEGFVPATVMKVINGHTIYVKLKDKSEERVRLIGVDTGEFSQEALEYTTKQLNGKKVLLETDLERYNGEIHAFVWLEEPKDDSELEAKKMFNSQFLLEGYAWTVPESSNHTYSLYYSYFVTFEEQARKEGKGLWGVELLLPPGFSYENTRWKDVPEDYYLMEVFHDGRRLLLNKNENLVIYDTLTAEKVILPRMLNSILSPDNMKIAFMDSTQGGVGVTSITGEDFKYVFTEKDESLELLGAHLWAPDSKRILVQCSLEEVSALYIADIEKLETKPLPIKGKQWSYLTHSVAWLDNERILLQTANSMPKKGGEQEPLVDGYRADLVIFDILKDKLLYLTDSEDKEYYSFGGISADKNRIVATLRRGLGHEKNDAVLIEISTGKISALTKTGDVDFVTSISPDGNWATYNSRSGYTVLVSLCENKEYKVLAYNSYPIWSPDSKTLYFDSKRCLKKNE